MPVALRRLRSLTAALRKKRYSASQYVAVILLTTGASARRIAPRRFSGRPPAPGCSGVRVFGGPVGRSVDSESGREVGLQYW